MARSATAERASRTVQARLPEAVVLDRDEEQGLLGLARLALQVAVRQRPFEDLEAALDAPSRPERRAATFVTLTEGERLRGCMGGLDASRPVAMSVATSALLAALEDPRFRPLEAVELPGLTVEISVLGPLQELDDPEAFRLGTDGVVVEQGGRRGLLLPEVATHFGLDQAAMLDLVCLKAGLPRRAWRSHAARVFAFRTHRFGGPVADGDDAGASLQQLRE